MKFFISQILVRNNLSIFLFTNHPPFKCRKIIPKALDQTPTSFSVDDPLFDFL